MKTLQSCVLLACLAMSALAQIQQKIPDPVPILKQISKQNDDGSYSFGYEAGDGSFKIETKYPDGSVQGKYGYVDDSGKLREVEYGASKNRGFEPSGNDINVPPPTISKDRPGPLGDGEEDDGQYREDPSIYDSKEYRSNLPKQATRRPVTQFRFQEPVQQTRYQEPEQQQPQSVFSFQHQPRQSFSGFQQPQYSGVQQQQQPQYSGVQQQQQQPQYSGVQQTFPRFQQQFFQNYQQPAQTYQAYQQPQQQYTQPQVSQYYYNGHPSVKNFDINSGSYSINYSGR